MTRKAATYLIAAGIGLLLVTAALYILLVRIPADLASTIAQGVSETFHFTPRVTINETVVIEQTTPIFEIATAARDLSVEYSWSHHWLGSTKSIALRGTFTAKAGFDLQEPFTLDITRYPLKVDANMPEPRILSIQMNSYDILHDESGWWNRISDDDRERAVRELQRVAREKAENSGILAEVRSTVEQRIKEIVGRNGAAVAFTYPWQEQ